MLFLPSSPPSSFFLSFHLNAYGDVSLSYTQMYSLTIEHDQRRFKVHGLKRASLLQISRAQSADIDAFAWLKHTKPSPFNSPSAPKVNRSVDFPPRFANLRLFPGVSVNLSYDVVKALIYSGLRSWKRRCRRTLNSLHNTIYPGHPLRGIAWCGIIYALYTNGHDPSYRIIDWIDEHVFGRYFAPRNSEVLACVVFGTGTYFILIQCRQYVLKSLFSYHGWMYQEHGKSVGIGPKIWGGLVKLFIGRNPSLYSYQSVLPQLPLPSLDETLQRYLRTVRPLYDDAEYHHMEVLAEDFKRTIGKKLQRYLWLKWLVSSNYVNERWLHALSVVACVCTFRYRIGGRNSFISAADRPSWSTATSTGLYVTER